MSATSTPATGPATAWATHRAAYAEADPGERMRRDGAAASRRLGVGLEHDLDRAARRSAAYGAPSLRWDDQPRERAKADLTVSQAAVRLAAALHLHLD